MVYVVLGMHKSGTTLVAEILHKSGIPMIGVKDGDPSYDKGIKYERVSTANLNKDILNSWDVEGFNIRASKNLNLSDQKRTRMIGIIRECQSHSDDWGFKPIPCDFCDFAAIAGGFHCASLDIGRRGQLKSYF